MKKNEFQELKFEIYQELGECYTHSGDFQKAFMHFEEAISFNSGSERPFVGLGVAEMQLNNTDGAKKYFEKAVSINPNSDSALTGLAMVLGNNGGADESLDKYSEALEINPLNMTALLGLIKGAYSLDRLPLAEKYLKKYLSHHPGNSKILFCLAGTLFKQGNTGGAKQVLNDLFIFEPQHADALELAKQIDKKMQDSQYGKCQNS